MTLAAFLRHLAFCAGLAGVSALVVLAMLRAGVSDRPSASSTDRSPSASGADPRRPRDEHERAWLDRLKSLPNKIYTDVAGVRRSHASHADLLR